MPLTVHGRFFHLDEERIFLRAVTYGPFPPGKPLDDARELARIAEAGFNTVRTYETPTKEFLDLLAENNLILLSTAPWHWDSLFSENRETVREARRGLTTFLVEHGSHPALGALLIANEIRPDLARFMGPAKVVQVLEELISHCRHLAPDLPCGYASFPTTEYLEPANADFTACNVYLEERADFASYLRRLHNVAGDRPLLLTEFGYDTSSEHAKSEKPEREQAEILQWALRTAQAEATAGFTIYSWSDLWFNGGREVADWSFGLTRRDGSGKPALEKLANEPSFAWPTEPSPQKISVAICTRNGAHHLHANLRSFENLEDENFEIIIIDDGSEDATAAVAASFIEQTSLDVRLLRQEPQGLSAARNHAAKKARGGIVAYIDDDAWPHPLWLHYLREAFALNPDAGAAGGPNLAPTPATFQNAIVTALPGNASHVLLDDTRAEHLPGCNLAIKRELLLEAQGFDIQFHTAGDDVDLCWRLLDAGYELAFHPAACVFHDRRPDILSFLRQQRGYGHAEALLSLKHPERFGRDGIRWDGVVYTGSALTPDAASVIYHGPMGTAPFQGLQLHVMPLRPLAGDFDSALNRKLLKLAHHAASHSRRKARRKFGTMEAPARTRRHRHVDQLESSTRRDFQTDRPSPREGVLAILQSQGWCISRDEEAFDLERGPFKLILAQTPQENGSSILHLRVNHPPVSMGDFWKEFKMALEAEKSLEVNQP